MKKLIFAATTILSITATAQLRGYQVAPCQFWTPSSTGSGYVCQNIPNTIFLAEAQSFANVIKAQDARIAQLEKDVADLKKICKPGGIY